MHRFSILPGEYRGSGAASQPHAQTRLQIGGRERRFLLKMREGVIYFQEPNRVNMWAVTRVFERELAGEELIEAWREEVARANYGRYVVYRPFLFDLKTSWSGGVQTTMGLVHRANYAGWAREWFDCNWRDVPAHRDGRTLDVWGSQFEKATRRVLHHTHRAFLDRALPASARRDIETRWARGSEAELQRVFALAMRLFVRDDDLNAVSGRTAWIFLASNPTESGGWATMSPGSYYQTPLRYAPNWNDLLKLLEQHFVLCGMSWQRGPTTDAPDSFNARQREKWGENWRGDWEVVTPQIQLAAQPVAHVSAHEKLETALELRDWLQGKIAPRQLANWLSKAL